MQKTYRNSLRAACLTALPLLLAACSAPDLSGEVGAFAAAEQAVGAPLKTKLDGNLAAARSSQIAELIRQGHSVYALGDQCQAIGAGFAIGQACVPEDAFSPNEETARLMVAEQLLASLEGYIDAVTLLAGSKAPEQIAAQIPVLTGDVNKFAAATNDPNLVNAGATIGKFSSALSIVAKMATEAARSATLRRVVREGDPAVAAAVDSLISVLEREGDTKVLELYQATTTAESEMETARNGGDPARYRAAVTQFEATSQAFSHESQTSLAGQLAGVRAAHSALAKRLAAGASLADVLAFTNELAQLRAAIDAAKG